MNSNFTENRDHIDQVKQWILSHLREECNIDEVSLESPLVEQLDSFQMVGFLVACDDKFQSLKLSNAESFSKLTLDEISSLIASKTE
jgi:acyl carrier protein